MRQINYLMPLGQRSATHIPRSENATTMADIISAQCEVWSVFGRYLRVHTPLTNMSFLKDNKNPFQSYQWINSFQSLVIQDEALFFNWLIVSGLQHLGIKKDVSMVSFLVLNEQKQFLITTRPLSLLSTRTVFRHCPWKPGQWGGKTASTPLDCGSRRFNETKSLDREMRRLEWMAPLARQEVSYHSGHVDDLWVGLERVVFLPWVMLNLVLSKSTSSTSQFIRSFIRIKFFEPTEWLWLCKCKDVFEFVTPP